MSRLRACWVTQGAVRIRRDPGEVHATSRQLNEEQDVEPPQEDRVDGQEIALEDARRLLTKELRPNGNLLSCIQRMKAHAGR